MLNRTKKMFKKIGFNSKNYWEDRYSKGGNSGAGSYDAKALYKAKVLNKIIENNNIENLIEFGCGDGNNLQYYNIPYYTGFDVSETAIKMCIEKYENDLFKSFIYYKPVLFKSGGLKADITISFEVIFHLIEDDVFNNYINNLFNSSSKYVLICSSNDSNRKDGASHVKHRKFTDSVPLGFSLIETIQTPEEDLKGFFSDFYLYQRNNDIK